MDVTEDAGSRALRETVAAIGARFGHGYFAENARSGDFPEALWAHLVDGGFAGANIDPAYGGGGGRLSDLAAVAEELAKAGCPLMTLVVSPALCGPILQEFGTAEQKDRWLTGIGSGLERMAFAVTEADAGANTRNIRTRAERVSEGWVLHGEKQFISGIESSRAVMVIAQTGTDRKSTGELSIFVVELNTPGLSASPIPMQVFATERQSTVSFDGVVLPESALIGDEGAGLQQLFVGLNPERIVSAATCLGIAKYAMAKAIDYARTREVWGVPIGAHQAIAHALAKAHIGVEAAGLLARRAGQLLDAGQECGAAANMAKFAAAEAAAVALDTAIQTHGGNGLADEYGLADLWGLTRLYKLAPVSNEMTLNHIAVHELGLPKSY